MLTLALVLAGSFTAELDRADLVEHGSDIEVRALDAGGEVIGSIAAWQEPDGIHIDADWPDGGVSATLADGKIIEIALDRLPAEMVAARSFAMIGAIPQAKKSWFKCAAYLGLGAALAARANPALIAESVLIGCECIPLIVPEWRDKECF